MIQKTLYKNIPWKQFLAWHADCCLTAPVTDCMNNAILKELLEETEYFANESDKRLNVDLRQSHGYSDELEKVSRNDSKMTITIETKNAFQKKMRLRVWGYTNGEYIFYTTVH